MCGEKKHIEDLIKLLQYIEGTLYRALLQYSISLQDDLGVPKDTHFMTIKADKVKICPDIPSSG